MTKIDKGTNRMVFDLANSLNQRFLAEAVKEWDDSNSNSFPLFLAVYVNQKWHELVLSN